MKGFEDTKITVLGEDWEVLYKDEDKCFEIAKGYCNECKRQIIIQNLEYNPDDPTCLDLASQLIDQKRVIRHEIVHAFLYESGLAYSSLPSDEGWAVNEEMVDWFARMSPKIFKVYKELKLL